ncbi:MAG: hypothetical protein JW810_14605 [Sedimentisphaerales bacterium]|nr:hypothetical protein [Sedimentisphaerales bacterium]
MVKARMPHAGHDKHLCYLVNIGFQHSNAKEYKALVREPKYMCAMCGRTAVSGQNLCKPVRL